MQKRPVTWGVSNGGEVLSRWGLPLKKGTYVHRQLYIVSLIVSLTKNFVPTPTPKSRVDSGRSPLAREKITMQIHLSDEKEEAFRAILFIMEHSDYHRGWSDENIWTYIIGPLANNKVLVQYNQEGVPIAFCTYAFLTEDRESSYMADSASLQISDFESEDGTLWCIDFAAPFGGCRETIRNMRKFFKDTYGEGTKARIFRTRKKRYGWMIA